MHVRAVCSSLLQGRSDDELAAAGGGAEPSLSHLVGARIIEQLVVNGVDGEGTLYPLREWLLEHTRCCNDAAPAHAHGHAHGHGADPFSLTAPSPAGGPPCEVTVAEFVRLLKDFSVMYTPDDVSELVTDLGVVASSVVRTKQRNAVFQDAFADSLFKVGVGAK